MVLNQGYIFLIFNLLGIIIGLLFDFFRILRKSFKTTDFITYIEDVIFWILTGILFIFTMYKFSNGELRIYMLIGMIIGSVSYMITLSKHLIKICVSIIQLLKTIIIYSFKIIAFPLIKIKRTIFRPLRIIYSKLRQLSKITIHKTYNTAKKYKKNTKKV